MKKRNVLYIAAFMLLLATTGFLSACNDWTDPESVDLKTLDPKDQDPELYAKYTQSLREYKNRIHPIVYARLDNAPEVSTNEKDFLRSLPDSLDIVSLFRSDKISKFDMEDMKVIQKDKGTRVIYYIDYTKLETELSAKENFLTQLGAYLDQVVVQVNHLQFDGISVACKGILSDEVEKLLVEKLSAIAGLKGNTGKLLMFEGNPTVLTPEHRAYFNYIVLNTAGLDHVYDLETQIRYANEFAGIPLNKIIATARPVPLTGDEPGGMLTNEKKEQQDAITETARRAISTGPIAGVGVYNVGDDYYNAEGVYKLTRGAIQILNPSPKK